MKKFIIIIVAVLTIALISLIWYLSSKKSKESVNNIGVNNYTTNSVADVNTVPNKSVMNQETSLEIRTALKNRNWLLSKATMQKTYLGSDVSQNIKWKFLSSDTGKVFVCAEDDSHSSQIFSITYNEGKVVATPILDHVADTSKEKLSVDIERGAVKCEYTDSGYKAYSYYLVSGETVSILNTIGYYPEYGNNGEQTGKSVYYTVNTEHTVSESEYTKLQNDIESNYTFTEELYELNNQNIEEMIK